MKKYREELYRKTVYCPTCRGVTPQGCPRCGGVGLVVVPATRGDVLRRMSDTIHSIENWLKEEMDE